MKGSICLVSHGEHYGGIPLEIFRSLCILENVGPKYSRLLTWYDQISSVVDFTYRNEDQYVILKEKLIE